MKDQREIVIRIIGGGEGGATSPSGAVDTSPKAEKPFGAVESVVVNEAYNYAKNAIDSEVRYELGKALRLSDDYVLNRDLAVAQNVLSKAHSVGMGVMAGFMAGGPIGGAVAIVGAMGLLGVQIYQNHDAEALRIRQSETQLAFTRQRAGWSLTAESYGEGK